VNGLIFIEVGKFAQARLGGAAWQRLARSAGVAHRVYVPVANYPDEELVGLLNVLSAEIGEPVRALLEALGEFIVPDLMSLAQSVIQPEDAGPDRQHRRGDPRGDSPHRLAGGTDLHAAWRCGVPTCRDSHPTESALAQASSP
jgi:hypothetical protein